VKHGDIVMRSLDGWLGSPSLRDMSLMGVVLEMWGADAEVVRVLWSSGELTTLVRAELEVVNLGPGDCLAL